jgi:16S rRNA G1207 methylase RsmC
VTRWVVGGEGPGAVALEAGGAAGAVPFHEVAAGRQVERAPEVDVLVPGYRGKRFLPVLSWLVTTRVAAPGAVARWRVERRHGPGPAQQALSPLGWDLQPERAGRRLLLHGSVPPAHELPTPRSFVARGLTFEADYGVFSPDRIDAGSALLIDVALGLPAVESVADIGTGYGALSLALAAARHAGRVVGTEADSVAAWLAERNARAAGLELHVTLDPDPLGIERTPLTVCNVPTHLDAARSAALMAALAERARDGRLLAVVHAGLEARYARHLDRPGLRVIRHAGAEHVVLEAAPG